MKKLLFVLFLLLVMPAYSAEVDTITNEAKFQKHMSDVGFKLLNSSRIEKIIPFYYDTGTKKVDAYTNISNKKITITKGLMRFIESDDELAAILGHEIGHAMFLYKNPFYYIPMFLDPKVYEFNADKKAIDLMVNAGYNPLAAIVIYSKFMTQSNFDWFPILSTHPKTSRRLANMYEYIYLKYPQYLINNEYKNNIYYQNFLLTSKENRKRFEAKAKKPSIMVRYK